jgi:3'(2'), 5'-bisphosphate nucleotidase
MPHIQIPDEIRVLVELAIEAGREIMDVYDNIQNVRNKPDLSPVTDADVRAERVILDGLHKHWPKTPVIAEESMSQQRAPELSNEFFLVDPLDGTREFIAHNGEFTVNIARISGNLPVEGVIYAPALRKMWWGQTGLGAGFSEFEFGISVVAIDWQNCHVRSQPNGARVAIASRSHRDQKTEEFLAANHLSQVTSIGSSLKFCLIAQGKADIYPRFGRTMEWDTAAGHAILSAAGGHVNGLDGKALVYGKVQQNFENPAFIASA